VTYVIDKVAPLTKAHNMREYIECGSKVLHILTSGTRWRWVVSFMNWLLCPQYLYILASEGK